MHIPHASRRIPPEVRSTLLPSDQDLARELLRMTDAWTDVLFETPSGIGCEAILFPVSRLVVDPERFEDDAKEPMARHGMGAVYMKTSGGRQLRGALSDEEREALLERFYRPHHRALEQAVCRELAGKGSALILDCHSYPSAPLPYEADKDRRRPEICIGTDAYHTPKELRETTVRLFEGMGFEVALDTPFAGSIVPLRSYESDPRVCSIMIEIRRDLYMDENNGERLRGFDAFKGQLKGLIGALAGRRIPWNRDDE